MPRQTRRPTGDDHPRSIQARELFKPSPIDLRRLPDWLFGRVREAMLDGRLPAPVREDDAEFNGLSGAARAKAMRLYDLHEFVENSLRASYTGTAFIETGDSALALEVFPSYLDLVIERAKKFAESIRCDWVVSGCSWMAPGQIIRILVFEPVGKAVQREFLAAESLLFSARDRGVKLIAKGGQVQFTPANGLTATEQQRLAKLETRLVAMLRAESVLKAELKLFRKAAEHATAAQASVP